MIDEHQKTVDKKLEPLIEQSINSIVKFYTPIVMRNPPDKLKKTIQTEKVTAEQAQKWIEMALKRVFPKPNSLISTMQLEVIYRDVTYETLNQGGFKDALYKAFPIIDWGKQFNEFNAAKEKSNK